MDTFHAVLVPKKSLKMKKIQREFHEHLFSYSKLTVETLEQGVKYVHS